MGNELWNEYHYGRGSYAYYDDGGVDRNSWNDVSARALRREKQAEAAFATIKHEWESKQDDLPPWSKHVIPLLDPSQHLVASVWTRFRRHVKNSVNYNMNLWDLQRREANAEERQAFRITRKSKAYFIDVIFSVGANGTH
jgi:hypothetical protein